MGVLVRDSERLDTKERILNEVSDNREKIENRSRVDPLHSGAFYHAVLSLSDEFRDVVEHTVLPENMEHWEYAVEYSYEGIELYLLHESEKPYYNHELQREEKRSYIDQVLPILRVKAKYLTAEEYAESRGVGVGTVRQWIRRGRIRTAKKFGKEWRISELSDPPQRGFTPAKYLLPEKLYGIPEDLQYLEGKRVVKIEKDPENKEGFLVKLFLNESGKDEDGSEKLCISSSDREKLELFLIGEPSIFYVQDFFDSVVPDLFSIPKRKAGDDVFVR